MSVTCKLTDTQQTFTALQQNFLMGFVSLSTQISHNMPMMLSLSRNFNPLTSLSALSIRVPGYQKLQMTT